jgi:hypothetical protein
MQSWKLNAERKRYNDKNLDQLFRFNLFIAIIQYPIQLAKVYEM